ncbi:MAG: division/cell wall cluster transcriptional repressor MraZ [Acidobacteriaceae bacterium]
MFRGNHPTRVDEKGRLKLPADFRSLLEGDAETKQVFYITSKDGERAELWPIRAWEEIEANLAKIPSTSPAKRKFLDVTNYYGQMAEMDGQGRLLLPQILRDKAGLTADVVVYGAQTYLEVLNRPQVEKQDQKLTADDMAELSGLGI